MFVITWKMLWLCRQLKRTARLVRFKLFHRKRPSFAFGSTNAQDLELLLSYSTTPQRQQPPGDQIKTARTCALVDLSARLWFAGLL